MRKTVVLGVVAFILGCSDQPSAPVNDSAAPWRHRPSFGVTLPAGSGWELDPGEPTYMNGISPNGDYAVGSETPEATGASLPIRASTGTETFEYLTLPTCCTSVFATAVNDYGAAVGGDDSGTAAIFWPPGGGGPVMLPPLSGDDYATARALTNEVNPTVVGISVNSGGGSRAVKWQLTAPSYTASSPTALGTEQVALIMAVNAAANVVVGMASPNRAARWNLSTGEMEELGFGGLPYDVNSSGVIVGQHATTAGFILDNGTITLTEVGEIVVGINDNGNVIINDQGASVPNGAVFSGVDGDPFVPYWDPATIESAIFTDISNNNAVTAARTVGGSTRGWVLRFGPTNADGDDEVDPWDNCANRANNDQADADSDGVGDVCDPSHPPIFTSVSSNRATAPEGSAVKFAFSAYDPGNRALLQSWSFTGGAVVPKASVSRPVGNPGTFTGTATANNNAGGVSTSDVNITVTNLVPALLSTIRTLPGESPSISRSGVPTTVDVRADDAGPSEQLTVDITWAAGVITTETCSSPCSFSADHTYFVPGDYKVKVQVTDANGGIRKLTLPFNVLSRVITLDLWPGSSSTTIDLDDPASAEIRVAVLGSASLDVRSIVSGSVRLTDGLGTPVRRSAADSFTDLNGDTFEDRVFRFSRSTLVAAGSLSLPASSLILTATLADGTRLQGVTSISVVP